MEISNKIELYYFNHIMTKPIIFFFVKIYNDDDEKMLEEHSEYLFKILIENNMAMISDILIFHIVKEHTSTIVNWILPSIESNTDILEQLEKNDYYTNVIIKETLIQCECNTLLLLSNDELKIQDCKIKI